MKQMEEVKCPSLSSQKLKQTNTNQTKHTPIRPVFQYIYYIVALLSCF